VGAGVPLRLVTFNQVREVLVLKRLPRRYTFLAVVNQHLVYQLPSTLTYMRNQLVDPCPLLCLKVKIHVRRLLLELRQDLL
jgi:hypothetical protein